MTKDITSMTILTDATEVEGLFFERSYTLSRIERAARILRAEAGANNALLALADDLEQIAEDARSAYQRWSEGKP